VFHGLFQCTGDSGFGHIFQDSGELRIQYGAMFVV
jgi:hypothetical protein